MKLKICVGQEDMKREGILRKEDTVKILYLLRYEMRRDGTGRDTMGRRNFSIDQVKRTPCRPYGAVTQTCGMGQGLFMTLLSCGRLTKDVESESTNRSGVGQGLMQDRRKHYAMRCDDTN